MMTKTCSRCKKTKSVSEFSFCRVKGHATRDGYSAWCKKCFVEYQTDRYKSGRGKEKEKEYREKAKDEYGSVYFKYRDSYRKRISKYAKTEKGKQARRTCKVNRRLREKGKLTTIQIQSVLNFYAPDNRCLCCGQIFDRLELDHVIPIKVGGTNTIDNIQPLCRVCNTRKFTQYIDYRSDRGEYARSLL